MTCPNCGWYVRGGARFCPNCGAEMPSSEPPRSCPFCNAKVDSEVGLCPNCGASMIGKAAEAAQEGGGGGAAIRAADAECPSPPGEAVEAKPKASAARVCPACKTELKGKVGICPICGEWLAAEPAPTAPRPSASKALKPLSPQWPFDQPGPAKKKSYTKKARPAAKPAETPAKAAEGAAPEARTKAASPAAAAPPARPLEPRAVPPTQGRAPEPKPAPALPDRAPEVKPWYVLRPTTDDRPVPVSRPAPEPRPAWEPKPTLASATRPQARLAGNALRQWLPWFGLLAGVVLLSVLVFGVLSGGFDLGHLSLLPAQNKPTATATRAPASPTPSAPAASVTPTMAITPTSAPTTTPAPRTHVVLAGESLGAIAQKYGVTLAGLMAANDIQDANSVRAGQELKIPESGGAVATATRAATAAVTATLAATTAPTAAPPPTTTGMEFPAPNLLTPAEGAAFRGAEDILLNWSSVGLLGDDTWYVVKVWSEDPNQPVPAAGWTRTNAWRITASLRPGDNATSRKMFWTVTVMRAREGQDPVAVSPVSATRSFIWE